MADHDDIRDVTILGAGFAGLCMAAALKRSGRDSFVVLERRQSIGGTWRDNTYPGCACDIPSLLYSFSFANSFPWSRAYPLQGEIWAYLKRCVAEFELERHLRFGSDVESARFDEARALWQVQCRDGRRFLSRFLVLGMGGLNRPSIPDLPGAKTFRGPTFHSSRWDHDADLAGKRIAVIGTGASAIQIVPELAKSAKHLTVFQRTPAWIVAKQDRALTAAEVASLGQRPIKRRLKRWLIYWRQELLAFGFTLFPMLMKGAERAALKAMHAVIASPELRERLTPHYPMGCKRILISSDFYPALVRTNVELEASPVAAIDATGVVTAQGRHVDVDAIVFATGFKSIELLGDTQVFGRDGVSLKDVWQERAVAHLGIVVHGFPNLFLLVGPNTGLGHNSIVFMIEAQVHFVMKALAKVERKKARSIEVKSDCQQRFARFLKRRLARTVWSSGCKSWYLDARGQNFALWPGFSAEYWLRTRWLPGRRFTLLS